MPQKVDWKAKIIDMDIKLSLSDLERIITNLSDAEQVDLITEILASGGEVLKRVTVWINEIEN